MGGSSSTQKMTEVNQIIYDTMIENNLGCDQTLIANQSLCASGFVLGLYQSQVVKAQVNCQQSQSYNSSIQQQLTTNLTAYVSTDSKWFVPAVTDVDTKNYVENVVDIHFTNDNIMAINNAIVATQAADLGCSTGQKTTAIGIYQNQNVSSSLKAIQDVMSKTTFYQDLLGEYDTSTTTSATFLGGFSFFLIIIFLIVAMVMAVNALMSPEGQKLIMTAAV